MQNWIIITAKYNGQVVLQVLDFLTCSIFSYNMSENVLFDMYDYLICMIIWYVWLFDMYIRCC